MLPDSRSSIKPEGVPYGFGLCAGICLGLAIGIARAELQFPKKEISDQIFSEAGVVSRTFDFKVVGETPTQIVKVTPSCGCTVADLPKRAFSPGEVGKLAFRYNPEGRQETQEVSIDVETETGGQSSSTRLTYRVNVLPAVILQPEIVFWKKEEVASPKDVLVRTEDSLSPKSFRIEEQPERFTAELRWDKEKAFHILTITPRQPLVPIKEKIRVVMEDQAGRHFAKTLYALVR